MSAESIEGRFARFKSHPDIEDVAKRYADWAESSEGIGIDLQLALFAMLRINGRMPRPAYRLAVRNLAANTTIPIRDFLILAKCQLELMRCGLAGSGQIPFTPSEWDAEGGEA